jgi:hypothetical protein
MGGSAVWFWKELLQWRDILIYFGMFKKTVNGVDLTFEGFKGRKKGYELHSRKNYWTLIGR